MHIDQFVFNHKIPRGDTDWKVTKEVQKSKKTYCDHLYNAKHMHYSKYMPKMVVLGAAEATTKQHIHKDSTVCFESTSNLTLCYHFSQDESLGFGCKGCSVIEMTILYGAEILRSKLTITQGAEI